MSRREAGGCEGAISRARGEGRGWQAGGGGAAGARRGAHRGQKRELYRGRCELRARGSAGGWRRAIHHGHAHPTGRPRRAPPAGQCSGGGGCQCRLGLLGRRPAPRRFQAGQTHAPALAASPVVPSGGAMSAWPRGGRLAARTALERRHVPSCTALAIHACPAQRSSGTGSWFGTGMGVRQRSGPLGGAHPVNRSQLNRRLELDARSRPMSCAICALFGQRPGEDRRPPSTGVVRDSSTEAQTSNLGETSYRLQKP